MDLKWRRRAIYTGMRPFFEETELMNAMRLWQEKYSNTPKYAFAEFLSECCQSNTLRNQRSQILSAIFKAMDAPESTLLEDPLDFTGQLTNTPKTLPSASMDANTELFMQLVEMLLARLSERDALAIRMYLVKNLATLKFDPMSQRICSDWIDKKVSRLNTSLSTHQIRLIMNLIYVGMCEQLGPVKADQLLGLAIQSAETRAQQLGVELHAFL